LTLYYVSRNIVIGNLYSCNNRWKEKRERGFFLENESSFIDILFFVSIGQWSMSRDIYSGNPLFPK
jgi:hypothetical protein